MWSGLNTIENLLDQKIDKNTGNADNLQDLNELHNLIKGVKSKLCEEGTKFHKALSDDDERVTTEAALNCHNQMQGLINQVKNDIGCFQAKSKDTNPIIKFINKVVMFFSSEDKSLKINPAKVIEKRLQDIDRRTTKYSKLIGQLGQPDKKSSPSSKPQIDSGVAKKPKLDDNS